LYFGKNFFHRDHSAIECINSLLMLKTHKKKKKRKGQVSPAT
jgi:hypothetical protein